MFAGMAIWDLVAMQMSRRFWSMGLEGSVALEGRTSEMSDSKNRVFDIYDAFIGVLQLLLIIGILLLRSPFLLPLGKILLAMGLFVIFLTRWTTKRSGPWWLLAGVGTVLALSSLVVIYHPR